MDDFFNLLFEAIDRMDADRFVAFLTEDATFRFGNMPALAGRDAIRAGVTEFFDSINGLSHRITGFWEFGNTVVLEGEVTYTRKDDSRVTIPFANLFTLSFSGSPSAVGNSPEEGTGSSSLAHSQGLFPGGRLIRDYRVYIDLSPLFSPS